jgi:hypothetical protein
MNEQRARRPDFGKSVQGLERSGLTVHEAFRVLGATCTDGPLEKSWRAGWAVHPFRAKGKAHWWMRSEITAADRAEFEIPECVTMIVERLCKMEDVAYEAKRVGDRGVTFGLLAPGNVPHCKLCQRKVANAGLRPE